MASGIGMFVGALSAVMALTCLAGAVLSLANQPSVWYTFGFEVVALIASVYGVLVGLGRYREGPALAILCVSGALAVGALLGYVGAPATTTSKVSDALPALGILGNDRELIGLPLWPLMLARFAAAGALGLAAGLVVISRRPSLSVARLTRAVIFGILLGAVAGPLLVLRARLLALSTFPKLMIGFVASVAILGLLAATLHYGIRAFEAGDPDQPED